MKRKLMLCFSLGILFSLGACKKQEETVKNQIYVGVSYYDQNDSFITELTNRFEKEVEKIGDKRDVSTLVTIRDAKNSQRQQNNQVEEMINAGCNVLCVNLVDRTDPSEIIYLGKKHNVPIIFFNREPVAEDLALWNKLFYVGGDARESGKLQGEVIAKALLNHPQLDKNNDGIIQYVVLEGEPGHQDAILRTEEAVNTLMNKGIKLEKLGYGIANWNRAQGENRMTQLIRQHQNNIEIVLSNNDDMALGAIDAYTSLNQSAASVPAFFGIDGTDEGIKAVLDGKILGTVYNNKVGQAKTMGELAADLSLKQKTSVLGGKQQIIYLPYLPVTEKNAKDYVGN